MATAVTTKPITGFTPTEGSLIASGNAVLDDAGLNVAAELVMTCVTYCGSIMYTIVKYHLVSDSIHNNTYNNGLLRDYKVGCMIKETRRPRS